jgi:hypothetical protein
MPSSGFVTHNSSIRARLDLPWTKVKRCYVPNAECVNVSQGFAIFSGGDRLDGTDFMERRAPDLGRPQTRCTDGYICQDFEHILIRIAVILRLAQDADLRNLNLAPSPSI